MNEPTEPTPGAPPPGVNWIVALIRSLTMQNVLTLALLAAVAAPSYFAWKFLTDETFRHEFTTTARLVASKVPCQVLVGNLANKEERHTVTVTYTILRLKEYIVGIQAEGLVSDQDLIDMCNEAHMNAAILTQAREDREELARERERAKFSPGASPTTKDH